MTRRNHCPKCGGVAVRFYGEPLGTDAARIPEVVECHEGHLFTPNGKRYFGSLWGSTKTLGSAAESAAHLARVLAVMLTRAEESE